jgi:hypothetical protein
VGKTFPREDRTQHMGKTFPRDRTGTWVKLSLEDRTDTWVKLSLGIVPDTRVTLSLEAAGPTPPNVISFQPFSLLCFAVPQNNFPVMPAKIPCSFA